jgi:hypothetical protein
MIDQLAANLVDFPGASNRARCFAHILNLVVKSIMRQFDMPKKRWDATSDEDLEKLAGNIEAEEDATRAEEDIPEDGPIQDNEEGWVDERDDMTEEDIEELEESVRPIRFLLTKVGEKTCASAVQY